MEEFVIGIIGRSHGIKGHVNVRSLSGETAHFRKLSEITAANRGRRKTLKISSVVVKGKGSLLVKFDGIDTPEDAKKLATWELIVPRENGASLKKNEHYISDLKNLDVICEGKVLGKLIDIVDGAGDLLAEIHAHEESFLIPYTAMYFGEVNLENKRIEFLKPWVLE